MEEFYIAIIIFLLVVIIAKLNQGNKKLSKKEIEKQKKHMWKVLWWMIGITILLFIFSIWIIGW